MMKRGSQNSFDRNKSIRLDLFYIGANDGCSIKLGRSWSTEVARSWHREANILYLLQIQINKSYEFLCIKVKSLACFACLCSWSIHCTFVLFLIDFLVGQCRCGFYVVPWWVFCKMLLWSTNLKYNLKQCFLDKPVLLIIPCPIEWVRKRVVPCYLADHNTRRIC